MDRPPADLFEAAAARDAGMKRAVDHADEASPGWSDHAFAFIREYARTHAVYSSEDISDAAAADPTFPRPTDRRAWGSPMRLAARDGVHARDGFAPRRHGHCSPGPRWRSLVFEG